MHIYISFCYLLHCVIVRYFEIWDNFWDLRSIVRWEAIVVWVQISDFFENWDVRPILHSCRVWCSTEINDQIFKSQLSWFFESQPHRLLSSLDIADIIFTSYSCKHSQTFIIVIAIIIIYWAIFHGLSKAQMVHEWQHTC